MHGFEICGCEYSLDQLKEVARIADEFDVELYKLFALIDELTRLFSNNDADEDDV
jgi:hypothetical protein